MEQEEWKTLPDYPNYRVSNFGRVMSFNFGVWKIRKLKSINKGKGSPTRYWGFNVSLGRSTGKYRCKTLKIHQEVAKLFVGPCPPGMLTIHKDTDLNNNRWDNLEYGTQSKNVSDAIKAGRLRIKVGPNGRFMGSEKL